MMSIKSFLTFKNLFSELSADKEKALFSELLFMVLAGAASADLNIEKTETDRIAAILKEKLDMEVTHADIKTSGEVDLSTEEIVKNVRAASHRLSVDCRQELLESVVEVFRSDGSVGPLEQDYFNRVVGALDLTPAQLLRL